MQIVGVLMRKLNYKKKTKNIIKKKYALSAGFEPAREYPNGFLVHRLNHSATTTDCNVRSKKLYILYKVEESR